MNHYQLSVGVVTNRESKKCLPPNSRGKTNAQQKNKKLIKSIYLSDYTLELDGIGVITALSYYTTYTQLFSPLVFSLHFWNLKLQHFQP